RSVPGRDKSSPDVTLLPPFGRPPGGWPFGAVMQVDGWQHCKGHYHRKSSRNQRRIDNVNDLAAWRACMPVLRVSWRDRALLPRLREAFLLALLANPGKPFIMLSTAYLRHLDWEWLQADVGAAVVCRLP
ncbi:hypothetical protein Agub_g7697, partial [Astrephomene gubernaculifera]